LFSQQENTDCTERDLRLEAECQTEQNARDSPVSRKNCEYDQADCNYARVAIVDTDVAWGKNERGGRNQPFCA
jgi:hypothetical protein